MNCTILLLSILLGMTFGTISGVLNLTADGLAIGFEAASSTVIVQGMADMQETKEKILLCCGNVHGVE